MDKKKMSPAELATIANKKSTGRRAAQNTAREAALKKLREKYSSPGMDGKGFGIRDKDGKGMYS